MQFPNRAKSHVTETASFKRLEQCIPDHWIVRHVSERDYGMDCIVEPVSKPDGPVCGDMLAIQLKGTQRLPWRQSNDENERRATFSGIEVETVNYWLGLPMPVFLCIDEQQSNSVYFAPVKHQTRRRYRELVSQKSFGFELWSELDLTANHSDVFLYAFYLQERAHPHFANALTDLLVNKDSYLEYITGHLQLDFFLEVDTPELVQLFRLYNNLHRIADFSRIEWKVTPLGELIKEDRRIFKDDCAILHERSQDRLLRELATVFVAALRKGCSLVSDIERDYWEKTDFLLVKYVTERGAEEWVRDAEQQLKWVLT